MTVCGIVNLSENIARGVFNNKPNLISRYKVTGIDNALRNLGIEMGLSTKNVILPLNKCNIVFFSLKANFSH